jgi:hypothetical protein
MSYKPTVLDMFLVGLFSIVFTFGACAILELVWSRT